MKLRRLVFLALGLLLLWMGGFIWFLRAVQAGAADASATDAIVVLTGGTERVETGFRLLDEGLAPRLFVSGVHPESRLADLARGAGLDPAKLQGRVELGHAAASTRGNAVEIAAWASLRGTKTITLVTAGYHMPRARTELRRTMPGLRVQAHPVTPARLRAEGAFWQPRNWGLLLGEYMKFLGAELGLSAIFGGRRI
ncbi:MAG: YdcF family protein [Roseomonas sp.]|nr:YdcF family protein [Roseomonas sp.]MCA3392737.1 YdcF family protein [Roseomonas sp.]MCA3407965.1 YdcF family protein [Roseomonas sp.]